VVTSVLIPAPPPCWVDISYTQDSGGAVVSRTSALGRPLARTFVPHLYRAYQSAARDMIKALNTRSSRPENISRPLAHACGVTFDSSVRPSTLSDRSVLDSGPTES
jgi:hypothetical protein